MSTSLLAQIVNHSAEILNLKEIEDYPGAWNGLQAENSGKVTRIAAAVDANLHTVAEAARLGADLLLVHHGLYWNGVQPLTGSWRKKVALLLEADIAVFSAHLPLDLHPTLGNNALLCQALGLKRLRPFFYSHGQNTGVQATVNLPRETLLRRLEKVVNGPVWLCPGGPETIRRIGVVTGGAGGDVAKAHAEGVDTFVSGEAPHHAFGLAEELGVNLFLGGHYATETFGVKALAAYLSKKYGVPWTFIDHPSGL